MNHYIDYTRPREYRKLNKFRYRMDYKTMNYEISNNLYKILLFQRNSNIMKIIKLVIIYYEKLGLKNKIKN